MCPLRATVASSGTVRTQEPAGQAAFVVVVLHPLRSYLTELQVSGAEPLTSFLDGMPNPWYMWAFVESLVRPLSAQFPESTQLLGGPWAAEQHGRGQAT